MPGKSAPARHAVDSPAPQAALAPKLLWALDGTPAPGSPVSDIGELTAAATAAVRAGDGNVLDTSHVVFPNGAITLVLILAELVTTLRLTDTRVQQVRRGAAHS